MDSSNSFPRKMVPAWLEMRSNSLMRALSVAPPRLSKDVVNLTGFPDPPVISDLETRRLAEIGQALLDPLDGKIQSGDNSTTFMPGS